MTAIGESSTNVQNFLISINTINVGTTINSPFAFNFSIANSINEVLGFNAQSYSAGFHISEKAANIINNSTTIIYCSAVSTGIPTYNVNDTVKTMKPSQYIYSFGSGANVGGSIVISEQYPRYYPVQNNIFCVGEFSLYNSYGQLVQNPDQIITLTIYFGEK